MKKYILITLIFMMTTVFSEKIEIKSGEGYRSHLTTVEGTFMSKYEREFPYVCYDKRIKITSREGVYLTYKGCTRVNVSCKSTGRAHFGKYPNDYESYKALNRCLNARPKFID